MDAPPLVSVVVPVHNGAATLGACLEALFSSDCDCFEVLVVDDGSEDTGAAVASLFPCTLIRLERRVGVSEARNTGAKASLGTILFFTDVDCLVTETALSLAVETLKNHPGAVVGGTYTPLPADPGFFSFFQSVLIHCFETKRKEPDYLATHAMAMEREVFQKSGGFARHASFGMAAGIEDVEFSHRLRRMGTRLVMNPDLLVRHHFGFNFVGSLKNAWRRSRTWTGYSITNGDLLKDSGAASMELKCNVASFFLCFCAVITFWITQISAVLLFPAGLTTLNAALNGRVISAFFRAGGSLAFAMQSAFYYLAVYPIPVGVGALAALMKHGCRKILPAWKP